LAATIRNDGDTPDLVVLSPHPDDAVWSCGGRIARSVADGATVLIVTVFDGDVAEPPRGWRQLADPRTRRQEDAAARGALGVVGRSWGHVDAALRVDRTGAPLYPSPRALFAGLHDLDLGLVDVLAERVAALGDVELDAPLGIGGHADHVLVREAVVRARPPRVRWYEEFPYDGAAPDTLVPDWHRVDVCAWLDAALRYRTQVEALLGDEAAFSRALERRARERGEMVGMEHAERTWRGEVMPGFASGPARE
jgi:LmbE family N-acetylglucosaminyl deacetylase